MIHLKIQQKIENTIKEIFNDTSKHTLHDTLNDTLKDTSKDTLHDASKHTLQDTSKATLKLHITRHRMNSTFLSRLMASKNNTHVRADKPGLRAP
jgi:hypothetical protein